MRILPLLLALVPLSVAACSSSSDTPAPVVDAGPDVALLGVPIDAPKNQWTWVDFPESSCDDGSPTGIGVYKADSPNLVVYLEGGGACWDYLTCFVLKNASHGPYQKAEFDATKAHLNTGIFDRTRADNPFKDWNQVYVPYCTGDVHSGNNVPQYTDGTNVQAYHHVGRPNLEAYLKRIQSTFPSPDKFVWTGSSAGGFGALFNYPLARSVYPNVKSAFLIDDSGPPFPTESIRPDLQNAVAGSWKAAQYFDPACSTCATDWSTNIPFYSQKYPNDRIALPETSQDKTISYYFDLEAPVFEAALRKLEKNEFDPTPNAKYYTPTGDSHTFLYTPDVATVPGTSLFAWLGQMINNDPNWKSLAQ